METVSNQGSLQGEVPFNSPPGPSGEFRGSREFLPTDRRRSIHWRSSAKRGQLMVREFDKIPQGEVRLAFNPALELGKGRDTTLEYSIKIAASLARRCFQDGRPFRMWPHGDDAPARDWRGVLEYLARLQAGPAPSVMAMVGQSKARGVSVAVVSAADRETLGMLEGQRPAGGALTVVLMQGFGPKEDPDAGLVLSRKGFRVVSCTPGRLPEALVAVGRAISVPAPAARAHAMAARAAHSAGQSMP